MSYLCRSYHLEENEFIGFVFEITPESVQVWKDSYEGGFAFWSDLDHYDSYSDFETAYNNIEATFGKLKENKYEG